MTPSPDPARPASYGQETMNDWSHMSPQEIVRRTRGLADGTASQNVWRACCDIILRRLGSEPSSFPEPAHAALSGEELRETPPPIPVRARYYLTKCPECDWVGSSEQCGVDYGCDDSDVYCPVCQSPGCEDDVNGAESARHGEAVFQRILAAEAELSALRSHNEGAAAMRKQAERVCVALYEGYQRFNPEERQAMIALSNAAVQIRQLPLLPPPPAQNNPEGGERESP